MVWKKEQKSRSQKCGFSHCAPKESSKALDKTSDLCCFDFFLQFEEGKVFLVSPSTLWGMGNSTMMGKGA